MCGIFGHTKFKSSEIEHSRSALHRLTHRGPDQWNDWADKNIYMGHRRLSIMDLSENGRQPMSDPEQETVVVVNGEIYNYLEIKKDLEKKYKFRSNSDSEVVLYGYKEWGLSELLKKLEGIFAIAIYDKNLKKMYIARDRPGIKPLYYSFLNGQFVWGSELKALKEFYKDFNLEVDYTALYDYLTYLYIPTPKTLYKDIFKLEPAHYLEVDCITNEFQNLHYWNLEVQINSKITLEEAQAKVESMIDRSVKEQLMSDVPLGLFLSGGVDSSIVTAFASKYLDTINSYSIGYGKDLDFHDETQYAQMVSERYGTNHKRIEIDITDAQELFPQLPEWYDEPYADYSAIPTYIVSKNAKESFTVALTGDGGDEVFGGYKWYKKFKDEIDGYKSEKISTLEKLRGAVDKSFIEKVNVNLELEYYVEKLVGLKKTQKEKYRKLWGIPEDYDDYWYFRKFYRRDLPLYTRLQYLDFHTYLPDDILTKVDRAAMRVALEARVPLLATYLIEYVFNLPEEIRFLNGEAKGLLKKISENYLPHELIYRNKRGFSLPMYIWQNKIFDESLSVQEYILSLFSKEFYDK